MNNNNSSKQLKRLRFLTIIKQYGRARYTRRNDEFPFVPLHLFYACPWMYRVVVYSYAQGVKESFDDVPSTYYLNQIKKHRFKEFY